MNKDKKKGIVFILISALLFWASSSIGRVLVILTGPFSNILSLCLIILEIYLLVSGFYLYFKKETQTTEPNVEMKKTSSTKKVVSLILLAMFIVGLVFVFIYPGSILVLGAPLFVIIILFFILSRNNK